MVEDEPHWHLVLTPSSDDGSMNNVRHADLSPDKVDGHIERVLDDVSRRGAALNWMISPLSGPPGLAERLQGRGLTGPQMCWGMLRNVDEPVSGVADDVEIREVRQDEVDLYVEASVAGWESPASFTDMLRQSVLAGMTHSPDSLSYFVALRAGQPIGSAALRLVPGSGYLVGGSVAPAHRRSGVYGALLAHRLDVLRNADIVLASVVALADTSGPICARHGFERVCELESWTWKSERP